MQKNLLALAIAGFAAPQLQAAQEPAGTYILRFAEAPLASWSGRADAIDAELAKFAATSPAATGARRLDAGSPDSQAYRALLAERRSARLQTASAVLGRVLKPQRTFDVVLNGVAVELAAGEADRLRVLPGVAGVERDVPRRPLTDAGPAWIGAPAHWAMPDLAASRGEGVVVGVIDTGINNVHPSFLAYDGDGYLFENPRGRYYGLCVSAPYRCNGKLIGIHDFTDEGTRNGSDLNGHGSHVAGTAVGNAITVVHDFGDGQWRNVQVSGVAPRAALISYKACRDEDSDGNGGGCSQVATVAATEQAVLDGVDVINYSIGGAPRDPWSESDALALLNARAAGVVVVVAAGNDGPTDGSVTAPGNAPWALTVAASSHDRLLANRLVDLQGGATPPPGGGVLAGAGLTAGYGPAAIVRDAEHPLCSTGSALDSPPTGASNPWSGQVFNGEIVLCERGVTARVAKSNNVRLAGGGGFILYNGPADAESVVADRHSIPGTHVGWNAGRALLDWLASGSGHRGRLEGIQLRREPDYADLLAAFSGRGRAIYALDALKPDLAAPGVSILAAANVGSGVTVKSGTSMATPHVAGAAALLRAARPDWGPAQVESALLGTARPVLRRSDGSPGASPFEQGAGLIDLRQAVSAGLYLPTSREQFLAAGPEGQGQPLAGLNRPSLVHGDCFEQCALERHVVGLRAANWQVAFDLPAGAVAAAAPAQFTLQPGQSQVLQFSFDLTHSDLPGTWVEGAVRLVPDDPAVAETRLPLALFASPGGGSGRIAIAAAAEAGSASFELDGYVALPEAAFALTELVSPRRATLSLWQDPTRDDPFDRFDTGSALEWLVFSSGGGRGRIEVEVSSASANDVDLFVGRDSDGDGLPSEAEQLCGSTTATASERCVLDVEEARATDRYWVVVQNWRGSGQADAVQLQASAVRLLPAQGGVSVHGPGRAPSRAALPLRLSWDLPDLAAGESRTGYLLLANRPDRIGGMVELRLDLTRAQSWASAPRVLEPGRLRQLRLGPGQAQERYIIEVPAGASELRLASRGAPEVQIHLARAAETTDPVIGPAPARGAAAASSSGSAADKQVAVDGSLLQPGRWYLTPVNTGAQEVEFELEAALQFSGTRPAPQAGAYYNPARSGSGVYFYTVAAADVWGLVWYTYDADGAPTWYLGTAPAASPDEHLWRLDLNRFTWNGERAQLAPAGEAILSLDAGDRFRFAWNLLGESGSEPMQLIPQPSCAQGPLQVSGLWYSPTRSGFGYSVLVGEGLETFVAYLYDGLGQPRWLLGNVSPFVGSGTMVLSQYAGACPLCAYSAPQSQPVGQLQREYRDGQLAQIGTDVSFAFPLGGEWNEAAPTRVIADVIDCP